MEVNQHFHEVSITKCNQQPAPFFFNAGDDISSARNRDQLSFSEHNIGAELRRQLFTEQQQPNHKEQRYLNGKNGEEDDDQPMTPVVNKERAQTQQHGAHGGGNCVSGDLNVLIENNNINNVPQSIQFQIDESNNQLQIEAQIEASDQVELPLQPMHQLGQLSEKERPAVMRASSINSKFQPKNFLKVFFYTFQFLKKMKFIHDYRNIFNLTKYHLNLLRDKGHGNSQKKKLKKKKMITLFQSYPQIKYLFSFIKKRVHNFGVFQPDAIAVILWNFLILLIIIVQLFSIPLQIGLNYNIREDINIFFKDISFWLLMADILISLNLGYYEEGIVVTKRSHIVKKYVKEKLVFELLTAILVQLKGSIQIVFVIRFFQIPQLLAKIDEHFQLQFRFPAIFQIIKLLFLIIFVAHWCGCGFHYISYFNDPGEQGWVEKQDLVDASVYIKYLNSLYYAVITMITVGYGDITPKTTKEKLYVVFMTLISCMVFAYVLNAVGSIVSDVSKNNAKFRKQRHEITEYMRARSISKDVQIQVIKYLQYINTRQNEGHQKGEQILLSLSKQIRAQVYREFYGGILKHFKIFYLHFSDKFLNALALHMREITLGPGEILFNQGEIDTRLFYIIKGDIELFIDLEETGQEDITLSQIGSGNYFGQYGFFSQKPRDSSARSVNITNLVYCSLDDFVVLLKQYPDDFEKYCQLKDNLTFTQQLGLGMKCFSCKQFSHSIMKCPLLHYEVDRSTYLKRYAYSKAQARNKRDKSKFRKEFHTYQDKQKVANALKKLRLELIGEDPFTQLDEYQDDKYFYKSIPRFIQKDEHNITLSLDKFYSQDLDHDEDDDDEEQSEENEDEPVDDKDDNDGGNKDSSQSQDKRDQLSHNGSLAQLDNNQSDHLSEEARQSTYRSQKSLSKNQQLQKKPTTSSFKKYNSQVEGSIGENQILQRASTSKSVANKILQVTEPIKSDCDIEDSEQFKDSVSNFYKRKDSKKSSNLSAVSNRSIHSPNQSSGQVIPHSLERVSSKLLNSQGQQASIKDLQITNEQSMRKYSVDSGCSKASNIKNSYKDLPIIKEEGTRTLNIFNNQFSTTNKLNTLVTPADMLLDANLKTGFYTSPSHVAVFQPTEIIQQQQSQTYQLAFISLDLDKICEFRNYYPNFNIQIVLKEINKRVKRMQTKKVKKKSNFKSNPSRINTEQKSIKHLSQKKSQKILQETSPAQHLGAQFTTYENNNINIQKLPEQRIKTQKY